MKIDVKITHLNNSDGSVKAFASANFDEKIAVNGIKIMDGKNGLFVAMPSYRGQDKKYHDVAFPVTKEFREELCSAVMNAYDLAVNQRQEKEIRESDENFDEAEYSSAPEMSM